MWAGLADVSRWLLPLIPAAEVDISVYIPFFYFSGFFFFPHNPAPRKPGWTTKQSNVSPDLPRRRNLRGPDEIQLWFSPLRRGGKARGCDYLLKLSPPCWRFSSRLSLLLSTCSTRFNATSTRQRQMVSTFSRAVSQSVGNVGSASQLLATPGCGASSSRVPGAHRGTCFGSSAGTMGHSSGSNTEELPHFPTWEGHKLILAISI